MPPIRVHRYFSPKITFHNVPYFPLIDALASNHKKKNKKCALSKSCIRDKENSIVLRNVKKNWMENCNIEFIADSTRIESFTPFTTLYFPLFNDGINWLSRKLISMVSFIRNSVTHSNIWHVCEAFYSEIPFGEWYVICYSLLFVAIVFKTKKNKNESNMKKEICKLELYSSWHEIKPVKRAMVWIQKVDFIQLGFLLPQPITKLLAISIKSSLKLLFVLTLFAFKLWRYMVTNIHMKRSFLETTQQTPIIKTKCERYKWVFHCLMWKRN